jgi:hydrogenase expression/formation protein HypE
VTEPVFSASCLLPSTLGGRIVMGHGGGGRQNADLLRNVFLPALGNEPLSGLEDQAMLAWPGGRVAFTTNSFVVRPLFFPGGDIGKLAVCGTVNDLAVGGARPLYLSAAFILEEGCLLSDLERVVESMRDACRVARVTLITGDAKVVDKGKGDQIFITTSGIGLVPDPVRLSIAAARPGDEILVSGMMGDHGVAILSCREGIAFETVLESDVAPLGDLTQSLLRACPGTRLMRDLTRGGLASALHEVAQASGVSVVVDETRIPVRPEVQAACELLGLDPLHVANEGKLVAVVPSRDAERALAALKDHPLGRDASRIGEVVASSATPVVLRSRVGGTRIVPLPAGAQLPRIC